MLTWGMNFFRKIFGRATVKPYSVRPGYPAWMDSHPLFLVNPPVNSSAEQTYDHSAMDDAWSKHFHGWQAWE